MARASALLALGKIGGTAHPSSRSDPARIMGNLKRRILGNTELVALMPVAGSMPAMGIRCPERQCLCLAAAIPIRETAARARRGGTRSGSGSKSRQTKRRRRPRRPWSRRALPSRRGEVMKARERPGRAPRDNILASSTARARTNRAVGTASSHSAATMTKSRRKGLKPESGYRFSRLAKKRTRLTRA
jgi:hypothetical protein